MPSKKKAPLSGKTIVVTRASDQSAELCTRLREAGASIVELPLIRTSASSVKEDVESMFSELWSYEWIVFTSPNGVRYFFELFFERFEDIRAFGGARIAAIGQGTVAALRRLHLKAELVPEAATSEALGEAMTKEQTLDNLNILLVTGSRNSEALRIKLEAATAIVDSVQVYATEFADISGSEQAERFRKDGADAIIFASGSAVESFVSQAASLKTSPNALRPATCSIGPATSATMKAKGLPVDMEASDASPEGIVKALTRHFASR